MTMVGWASQITLAMFWWNIGFGRPILQWLNSTAERSVTHLTKNAEIRNQNGSGPSMNQHILSVFQLFAFKMASRKTPFHVISAVSGLLSRRIPYLFKWKHHLFRLVCCFEKKNFLYSKWSQSVFLPNDIHPRTFSTRAKGSHQPKQTCFLRN